MRETFTYGEVGRAPGNRCLYPEADSQGRGIFDYAKLLEFNHIIQIQWQPWLLLSMAFCANEKEEKCDSHILIYLRKTGNHCQNFISKFSIAK